MIERLSDSQASSRSSTTARPGACAVVLSVLTHLGLQALSAVAFYLVKRYGWTAIESREKVAGCRDGRIARVTQYSLDAKTIAAAAAAGASVWCASVHSARAGLRAKAADAYRHAERMNRVRSNNSLAPHQQWELFEGEAVPQSCHPLGHEFENQHFECGLLPACRRPFRKR